MATESYITRLVGMVLRPLEGERHSVKCSVLIHALAAMLAAAEQERPGTTDTALDTLRAAVGRTVELMNRRRGG